MCFRNNNGRKKEKKVVFDAKEKGSGGTAAATNKKGRKNNIKQKAKEVRVLNSAFIDYTECWKLKRKVHVTVSVVCFWPGQMMQVELVLEKW